MTNHLLQIFFLFAKFVSRVLIMNKQISVVANIGLKKLELVKYVFSTEFMHQDRMWSYNTTQHINTRLYMLPIAWKLTCNAIPNGIALSSCETWWVFLVCALCRLNHLIAKQSLFMSFVKLWCRLYCYCWGINGYLFEPVGEREDSL